MPKCAMRTVLLQEIFPRALRVQGCFVIEILAPNGGGNTPEEERKGHSYHLRNLMKDYRVGALPG
jgi:hypothetical protein